MSLSFATAKIHELLARFESALKTRYAPHIDKELVFNRMRVYKAEGYVECVAFSKALADYGFHFE